MNGHLVWDVDPVLMTVPVNWLRIIGVVAMVGLAIAAARYFWRGHKRGSEEDRSGIGMAPRSRTKVPRNGNRAVSSSMVK